MGDGEGKGTYLLLRFVVREGFTGGLIYGNFGFLRSRFLVEFIFFENEI